MTERRVEPKTLVLVRHGLTDWNEQGRLMGRSMTPINANGRLQAEELARALGSLPVGAIFSSPRPRTRQTAEPIAEALGLEVEVLDDLDEVWLSDRWAGRTVDEIADDPELEKLIEDPTRESPRLEPLHEVEKRVVACVDELLRSRPEALMVVVSHGDPLRLLLAHHLDVERRFFRRLTVTNGSVSALRFGARGVRMILNNWRPALHGLTVGPLD